MHRYDYVALQRDFIDVADIDTVPIHPTSSGPDSIASTLSSTSESINDELRTKYERLQESYKRLQRNNISLEEKLLNVSEKFNADKNLISRDLATQTQKVVEAKLTIQELNKENLQLKSDLKVALKLLQNKPSAFVPQRLASLPVDLQARVREQARAQERNARNCGGGQKICVPVPLSAAAGSGDFADNDEAISAAILAKVLEQRERERSKDKKFCIDIGTQTHAWIFPDPLIDKPRSAEKSPEDEMAAACEAAAVLEDLAAGHEKRLAASGGGGEKSSDESGDSRGFSKTTSSKSQSWESDFDSECSDSRPWTSTAHVSNLLLASVIQPPPAEHREADEADQPNSRPNEKIPTKPKEENAATSFHNGSAANKNGGERISRDGPRQRETNTAKGHLNSRYFSSDESSYSTVRRSLTLDAIGSRIGVATPPSLGPRVGAATPPSLGPRVGAATPPSLGPRLGDAIPPSLGPRVGAATPPSASQLLGGDITPPSEHSSQSFRARPSFSHNSSSSSLLRYSDIEERGRRSGTERQLASPPSATEKSPSSHSGTEASQSAASSTRQEARTRYTAFDAGGGGRESRGHEETRSLVMTRSMSYSSYQTDL